MAAALFGREARPGLFRRTDSRWVSPKTACGGTQGRQPPRANRFCAGSLPVSEALVSFSFLGATRDGRQACHGSLVGRIGPFSCPFVQALQSAARRIGVWWCRYGGANSRLLMDRNSTVLLAVKAVANLLFRLLRLGLCLGLSRHFGSFADRLALPLSYIIHIK